jgi:tRNA-dihydrouridine synthase 2
MYRDSEILAPMVRASTTPLRILALHHGASLTYTEELIDRSILQTEREVNVELNTIDYRVPLSSYSSKVQRRMVSDNDNPDSGNGSVVLRIDPSIENGKLVYQIGTGESGLALQAAQRVMRDVAGIDINMGCPKKFSVGGGMGSALLSDPRRACDILSTLRRNLGNIPVSAKVRLLHPTDPRPTLDFVRSLIRAGANAVAIHGRIVGDEGHVMARWETLVEVIRQLKHTESVPIIANGDLYTRSDILEMKRRSMCDGVMLARPALYNVSIFRRGEGEGDESERTTTNFAWGEEDESTTSSTAVLPLLRFQATEHAGYHGYRSPLLHSRTSVVREYVSQCVRYRNHSKNSKYVVLEMMNSRRAPSNRVPYLDMTYEGGQTIANVCKCRSLNDLVRIWDVRHTIPLPMTAQTKYSGGGEDGSSLGEGMTMPAATEDAPSHNYDDRYFLDHDAFRRERSMRCDFADVVVATETASSSGGPRLTDGNANGENDETLAGENKRREVTSSSPISKRPKLI